MAGQEWYTVLKPDQQDRLWAQLPIRSQALLMSELPQDAAIEQIKKIAPSKLQTFEILLADISPQARDDFISNVGEIANDRNSPHKTNMADFLRDSAGKSEFDKRTENVLFHSFDTHINAEEDIHFILRTWSLKGGHPDRSRQNEDRNGEEARADFQFIKNLIDEKDSMKREQLFARRAGLSNLMLNALRSVEAKIQSLGPGRITPVVPEAFTSASRYYDNQPQPQPQRPYKDPVKVNGQPSEELINQIKIYHNYKYGENKEVKDYEIGSLLHITTKQPVPSHANSISNFFWSGPSEFTLKPITADSPPDMEVVLSSEVNDVTHYTITTLRQCRAAGIVKKGTGKVGDGEGKWKSVYYCSTGNKSVQIKPDSKDLERGKIAKAFGLK